MPLLDHFHPPLSVERHWEAFHGRWAAAIADALNTGGLPKGYFAEMQVQLGGRVEVDVATLEAAQDRRDAQPARDGGVALLEAPVWAPPLPALALPAVFPDELEVLVFGNDGGPMLVGAIELVSPANKARPAARTTFAIKCLSYLQKGIGVLVVDVVTSRLANLHDEMADLIPEEAPRFPGNPALYTAAYRPVREGQQERIDVWPAELRVGQALPVMPLWLRGFGHAIRVELEATYTEARQRSLL